MKKSVSITSIYTNEFVNSLVADAYGPINNFNSFKYFCYSRWEGMVLKRKANSTWEKSQCPQHPNDPSKTTVHHASHLQIGNTSPSLMAFCLLHPLLQYSHCQDEDTEGHGCTDCQLERTSLSQEPFWNPQPHLRLVFRQQPLKLVRVFMVISFFVPGHGGMPFLWPLNVPC